MTKIGESFANVQFGKNSFLFSDAAKKPDLSSESQFNGLIKFGQSTDTGLENEPNDFLQEIMDAIDSMLSDAEDSDLPSFADTKPDDMAEAKQKWAEEQQKWRDSLPSFADTKPQKPAQE